MSELVPAKQFPTWSPGRSTFLPSSPNIAMLPAGHFASSLPEIHSGFFPFARGMGVETAFVHPAPNLEQ